MKRFTRTLKGCACAVVALTAAWTAAAAEVPVEPGLFRTDPTTNAYDYLLVSPPAFYADWCWYVGQRRAAHPDLRFAVKDTAAIYDAYPFATNLPCRNAAESIHAYLRSAYTNVTFRYVVLGGAWLDAQNLNGYTPCFATGEQMSLSNCVPGIYGFPRENWRQIPSDMFYACIRLSEGEKYPWDANGDGKYIDQNDCANNNLWPDVCVSRLTLNPQAGGGGCYNPHALVTNYVAKLKRGEAKDFAGHYRYGFSAASTGSSKLRKSGDRMCYTELEFYDGLRNMFDPLHHDSLEDCEYSVRTRTVDQYSMWRPVRSVKGMMNYTWTGGQPTLAAAMDDYYAADRDFAYVQAHGWAQGAAQFSAPRFATAKGLTLFNGGSGPCETGYPDYYVQRGGQHILQYNVGDAAVTNPDGGALASVNNSRWSWAGGGGYGAMSYYMLNEMLIGFNEERKDVGHAWLRGVQNYWCKGRWGNTAGWVLTEQFLYGDPLVRLPQVPHVWWTGGATGVWDRVTANWTNNVDAAKTFDAASNVYFTVGRELALDVAGEIAALRLSLPVLEEDATLTLAGTGSLRVLQAVDVAGTNATLRFGVAGGVGHNGIRFLTGSGNLVFGGTNRFYVGGVSNARQIRLAGGGVTLDVDAFPSGSFPLVFDGRAEPVLPEPNILRSKNVGGLTRFGPLALTNTYVKLSTVDAFGRGAPRTHTLVDSTLEIGANVYYQRSGFPEGLNATFRVDGDSAVTSSLGGLWTVKHTTTFALGDDAHLTLAADTVAGGGRIVVTNALAASVSNSLTVAHGSALAGDVVVGKGIRLILDELPLASVTSLTIGEGATVQLPEEESGYWQIVPVSATLACAKDVTFASAADPTNRLAGSASTTGAFFRKGALYEWTGAEGDWNTFFANRHPKILFGDLADSAVVTVRVAAAVAPHFAFFANTKTAYVFAPAADDASVLFSSVSFCGPTVFDVPVGATEYVEISGATSRFCSVAAPSVHVAAGAGLALAGSHWTEFRLDEGAVLVAVPGETLDWNAETTFTLPDQGRVLVDVGALELSATPTPLVTGLGHVWTLDDLQDFALVQPDAEFRIVDGTLCVVRGDGLKGPYELAVTGSTNWNNAAWTADGTNRTPFGATWAARTTDWSTDATIVLTDADDSTFDSRRSTLALDCDIHLTTLAIETGTNDFALVGTNGFTSLHLATLDLTGCHGTTDIAVDTGNAAILTESATNGTDVIRLRGAGTGTISLAGVTLILDRPGGWSLAAGAQGILRVVAPQAYERFRIASVPSDFTDSGLTVIVTDADGNAIDGFSTSVADGALWCVPPPLQAEVPPGTNEIKRLVWRDALGNVVSNVDWTSSAGFRLIGTETSGVVIAKSGFATLWNRLSVSNEVTLYGREILSPTQIPGGSGVLALAGAFTLQADVNKTKTLLSGAKLKLNEGTTLEIRHQTTNYDARGQDWSGLTGTGRVVFLDPVDTWIALPSQIFASTLSVETVSDLVLTEGYGIAHPLEVRNLSGSGRFRSDWSTGNPVRPVRTVQTGVTAFSGCLHKQDNRTSTLAVASDDAVASTNKALILNGAAVESHALTIETNGCVILTGAWQGPITVKGLLVITNACATNGLAVTIAPGGAVREIAASDLPTVTTASADYVEPTYPDDPAPQDEPESVDTRTRIVSAAVGAGENTWTRLDWRGTNGLPVAALDWSAVTNATITATNGAARILCDAAAFSGVVRLAGDVTVEARSCTPFTLAAESEGAVDFRLSPEPTATCDLLYLQQPEPATSNPQPATATVTVHNRYGRALSVPGEVAYDATAGKYVLNVQKVNAPTYSGTFDTQYADTLTSSLWFNGSGNLTFAARPDLFETSRAGRALKGTSSGAFTMYSHNGGQTYSVDNLSAVSLHLVAKLPSNDTGTLIGLGNKKGGNGLALARVSQNVAGVYVWENAGAVRLVASATVPFASDQFHAYAVTHDGQTLRFYVDGVLAQEATLVGRFPSTGYYQWFNLYGGGGLSNGGTSVVDDFRLYLNCCLTPTSVAKIAEDFPPWPTQPTAEVDVPDLTWTNLYWSAAAGTNEVLTLVAGAGSLLVDAPVVVSNALAVTGGTVPLALAGDGELRVSRGLTVASVLTLDVAALDGTNLAACAVANVPFSRWLVRGPCSGTVSVTNLPAVPEGYGVRVESFANLGVRLVFTAPDYAVADAFGLSVGNDDFTTLTDSLGLHPTSPTNWHAYATWSSAPQEIGGLRVTGSEGGAVDGQSPYGAGASVARYFAHTSFDGNNDTYNGKTNGLSLAGLASRFAKYRVLVYLATDTENANFGPVTIAGRTYTGVAAGTTTGAATVSDSSALAWGKSRVTAATEGVNVVISDVLMADAVPIFALRLKNGSTYARGQIAAVEIVEVGKIHVFSGVRYSADVTASTPWRNGDGAGLANHSDWRSDAFSTICLTAKVDAATLTFDTPVTAERLTVVSTEGQTLALCNGTNAVAIARYDFSAAAGTVALSNDVPAGTVLDLGRRTVLGGAMNGTFGKVVSGSFLYATKTNLTVSGAQLPAGATNAFRSAVVNGDVYANRRTYLVQSGDDLTIRPSNGSYDNYRFSGHVVVAGGHLLLDSKNQSDRFWYGVCGDSSFTQTDGETVANAKSDVCGGANNGCFLIGNTGSGDIPFKILGGTFAVPDSPVCFWQRAEQTLTVGGTGIVRVKGLWGNGRKGTVTVQAGGVLSVGAKGVTDSLVALNLNGGTLTAHADATTAMTLTLGTNSTLAAEDGVTHTVTGAIAGNGKLTIGAAGRTGTVVLAKAGALARPIELVAGVLDLGTNRPTQTIARTDGEIRLRLTAAEEATQTVLPLLAVPAGETTAHYRVFASGGAAVGDDLVTIEDGVLTVRIASKLSYVLPGTTVTQTFAYAYHPLGTDNHDWATVANWASVEILPLASGATETNYTVCTAAVAPALKNGSFVPVAFDGCVVTGAVVEGWVAQYGLFHGADVTITTLDKYQGGGTGKFVAVDATSRLTIVNSAAAVNSDGAVTYYVAAPSGIVHRADFAANVNLTINYVLAGAGSVCYEKGFAHGTHVLKSATIEQGDTGGTERQVRRKYLVIGSGTVSVANVTVANGGTRQTDDAAVTADDPVGTYRFGHDATGTFIDWVAARAGETREFHPSETDAVLDCETTNRVKIVCTVTNGDERVKIDLTSAFTLEKVADGVRATLDPSGTVRVPAHGAAVEEWIAVRPELGTVADDEHVASAPFVVRAGAAAVGVKTIPGLVYRLMRGATPAGAAAADAHEVARVRAVTTRQKLEDTARPTDRAFYLIRVETDFTSE